MKGKLEIHFPWVCPLRLQWDAPVKYLAEMVFFGCLAISIVAKIYLSVLFTNCAALFHLVKLPMNEAYGLLFPAFPQFHPT